MKFHSKVVVQCAGGVVITYRKANAKIGQDGVLEIYQLVDGKTVITDLLASGFWNRSTLVEF